MVSNERTIQELRQQYEIEKRLAQALKDTGKDGRRGLYSKLYDELLTTTPGFPQLTRANDPQALVREIRMQMNFVEKFISPESTFLELGAGDCRFALELASHVKKVYAIEASRVLTRDIKPPSNFDLIVSDGISVPVDAASINVAYSHQYIEHLHPDDFVDQLQDIYRALVKGGVFICATPHRFSGPHDISKYFDREACGLHLKEYINAELYPLFTLAGFSSVKAYLSAKLHILFPLRPIIFIEYLLGSFPLVIRRKLAKTVFKRILGIYLIATK